MLRHTLKLAFRNYRIYKGSFFINLLGLSSGLACALVIFLWVQDEFQMDKFHEKDERLFRVMEHQKYAEGIMTFQSTPGLLARTLKEEIPEIDHAATIMWRNKYTLSVADQNIKAFGHYTGKDFFNLFSFRLTTGHPDQVLDNLNSIVISESTADKLYGSNEAAIGKTIELDHQDVFTISGIFEDPGQKSSMKFDFVLPYDKYLKENDWISNWENNSPMTIVTLSKGTDKQVVEDKIGDFIKKRVEDSNVTLFLKSFSERYLYGRYENGKMIGGRVEYTRLFSIVAVFILLIACINFMNLSTARGSRRAKEVGVKKVVGVKKRTLLFQYLTESILIALLSLVIALILIALFLPEFNAITDKQIRFHPTTGLIIIYLGVTVITGLLAGSYPAFYLSAFKPAIVLKGEIRSSLGELWARRGLVVFQFALSVILIVSVLVVYRQNQYVQSKNLGYAKDNLISFIMDGTLTERRDAFLEEAGKLPGISHISSIAHDLIGMQNNTSGLDWDGKNPEERILFEHVRVNYDLLETIGVSMKEGRTFSKQFRTDSSAIILNEASVRVMGLQNPVGKYIRMWDEFDLQIIGVVKDFHFQSLHEEINPLFFRLVPDQTHIVIARVENGREQEAIKNLESFYKNFNPGFTFDYRFLDEQYALQYAAEQRVATLSRYFAGFAVFISCLGLFGLAIHTSERRKKEIGIRKIIGASVMQINALLTKEFTRLVLISILIGLPVSYIIMREWLARFVYRIDLSPWYFLIAGLTVLIISWLTVSSQAYLSANLNPKDCLRNE